MSRVTQLKWSQRQLRLPISICMTHSLNQMHDRQFLQTSLVSTLYESISHSFPVQCDSDEPQSACFTTNARTHRWSIQTERQNTLKLYLGSFDTHRRTHECTYIAFMPNTITQMNKVFPFLWKSFTKCLVSSCSWVPADRRTYTSLASAMPVKCLPIKGHAFVPYSPVLSSTLLWPDPLPCSLNDWFFPMGS